MELSLFLMSRCVTPKKMILPFSLSPVRSFRADAFALLIAD